MTRGSSIIAWSSIPFIGPGGAQIQFTQFHRVNAVERSGDTVATLVDNRVEGGVQVLVSTLRVTPSSMYPVSSVTCINVDNDGRHNTTTFQVINGKHRSYLYVTIT